MRLREEISKRLPPVPKSKKESVAKSMRSNKRSDTGPEILLRKALWKEGLRGYRKNFEKVPGSPDICFVSKKLAIFINGCFWHRCPKCDLPMPKSNTEFWTAKFERNIERDKKKIKRLKREGWSTLIVWECEIKTNMNKTIIRIDNLV
jgi:DNA mismatch endonuclease (patch repair protein)